jgi:predicted nucleic acid-binding protein
MRFWDSSALAPLFVEHARSAELHSWLVDDSDVVVWTLADVELRSAFTRLGREGKLPSKDVQEVSRRADEFQSRVHVVPLEGGLRTRAKRLLGVHTLRVADAMQLAAALVSCSDDPSSYELVTLDARLAEAARREGFHVRP